MARSFPAPQVGELLVEMGLLDAEELPALIALHAELRQTSRRGAQRAERLLIGRLLVEAGVIDEATLEQALGRSRRSGRWIGETLVDSGAISTETLQRFLRGQSRLSAFTMAGLALSAALHAPTAAAGETTLRINATVLSRALIDRQQLPQEVVVSEQDVARGYVDVEEPVEVAFRSNVPTGVRLGFTLNSRQLAAVDVREGSLFVPQRERGLRASTVSVRLRLRLAPDALPGRIAAPLTLFLVPG